MILIFPKKKYKKKSLSHRFFSMLHNAGILRYKRYKIRKGTKSLTIEI